MSERPVRYGKNTEAALENFGISGRSVPIEIVRAIAEVKAAAAGANAAEPDRTGVDRDLADAIVSAADEVIAGDHDDQFPIDLYQTGSGTSTNMNVNEVIASLASAALGRPVHPNDHVNASQSSNDVVPTALRVATLRLLDDEVLPALGLLADRLDERARDLAEVAKPGRTHLMDATPILLGDEFEAYRTQVAEAIERLADTRSRVGAVPLGGTAVGNGINASPGYQERVIVDLAARTGLPLVTAPSRFAAQGSADALVELSAQLRGAAVALYKIANDIRFLASGPRTGIGELRLAELQPGSSIMPGKVNPVICEVVIQAAARIIGNDATVAFAGTQGNLELNVFQPVLADALLDSERLLANAAIDFAEKCIAILEVDRDRCRALAEATPALATALNTEIGYDAATDVVRRAAAEGRSIRDTVVESGLLDADTADRLLDVTRLARGAPTPPG